MREHPRFITLALRRFRAAARRRRPGFSLLELMVVVAIFSVLVSIVGPSYIRARQSARVRACVKQIRTLQAIKDQYAMMRRLPQGAAVSFADLVADGLLREEVICPDGFPYAVGAIGEDVICTSGLPGHHSAGPY